MSNFSDYINNNDYKSNQDNKDLNKSYHQDDLEKMIDKYSSYDKDSLMKEFLKLTLEKKKRGELGVEELDKLKNLLSPMLNSEQKSNLNEILELIQNVK